MSFERKELGQFVALFMKVENVRVKILIDSRLLKIRMKVDELHENEAVAAAAKAYFAGRALIQCPADIVTVISPRAQKEPVRSCSDSADDQVIEIIMQKP